MKDGQTGGQMYHGTGTLLTMDLTEILWVGTVTCNLYKVKTAFSDNKYINS